MAFSFPCLFNCWLQGCFNPFFLFSQHRPCREYVRFWMKRSPWTFHNVRTCVGLRLIPVSSSIRDFGFTSASSGGRSVKDVIYSVIGLTTRLYRAVIKLAKRIKSTNLIGLESSDSHTGASIPWEALLSYWLL